MMKRPRTRTGLGRWAALGVVLAAVAPISGDPPLTAAGLPHITPSFHCKIVNGASTTYWLGYSSDGYYNIVPSAFNRVTITDNGSTTTALHQIEQFQSGGQAAAFAVTAPSAAVVTWSVTQANTIAESALAASTQAVSSNVGTIPGCAAGTSQFSAVVQRSGSAAPAITWVPGVQTRTGSSLTAATMDFQVTGATSVCSPGLKALTPVTLWGFNNEVFSNTALPGLRIGEPYPNFDLPESPAFVRVDILTFQLSSVTAPARYGRTWENRVRIEDPQELFVNSLGEQFRGRADVRAIADVYGRCAAPDGTVVTSVQPFHVAVDGFDTAFFSYTAGSPQTTTAVPASCSPMPLVTEPGCPFNGGSTPTGGARAKR